MSKKKVGIGLGVVAVLAAGVIGALYLTGFLGGGSGSSSDKVYVQSVSEIMGTGIIGTNRYAGVVEPQNSWKVAKDDTKTVKEIFVEVGSEVKEGDPLFEYDLDEISIQVEQLKLELEEIENEITDYQRQIQELQAEKATVPAEMQLEYTTQIQTVETSIKQAEYNKKSKQKEIDKTKESMENSVVTSKIAGVVQSINQEESYEESETFMTVLATGDYQIKGTVNEQNRYMINEGDPVIIRSRVDENTTWTGSISKIDTENTISDNNDIYYSSGDETVTSTKYPFYVALDDGTDLMLGQHVFIELDLGQQEVKEGVWLYSFYIVQDDGDPYVWAASDKNKLEKRKVTLGEYDEMMDEYEIVDGLTSEDMIAYPMPKFYEGITTVTDYDEVDYESDIYQTDDTEWISDEDMWEEGTEWMDESWSMDTEWMYDTEWSDEPVYVDEADIRMDTEVSE